MIRSYGIIILLVNFVNIGFLNQLVITAFYFTLKRLIFFKFLVPLTLYTILQAVIIENIERSIQNFFYILHLTILYALVHKHEFVHFRSKIINSILILHTILLVYFLISGHNFGRVKDGGFVGIFDEASVCAISMFVILLTTTTRSFLTIILISFILMTKSLTGIILLGSVLFLKVSRLNSFLYRLIPVVSMLYLAYLYLPADHRLIIELLPALKNAINLNSIDVNLRASSSEMRIAYEVFYLWDLFTDLSISKLFGGVIYQNRTADLNYFTSIFINFGIIGGLLSICTLLYIFIVSKASIRSIIGFTLISFVTGAFLKPLVTFLILLLITDAYGKRKC